MKKSLLLGGLLALAFNTSLAAEPPKMKMTTEVPSGIATPDKLETRLGPLRLRDGVPDEETARKVYDNLDFQHAVQAYLSSMQIASMSGMRNGLLQVGPANKTVLIYEDLMDSKALWLTPNTTVVYMALWLELDKEPVVMETTPNVLGLINDAWFNYVADFGNAGPDKGEGGKFLILPPGYKAKVPSGYHVLKTKTYGNWFVWRGFMENGSTRKAVETNKKQFRLYPLSQADNPPALNFVNMSGKFNNTIHRMDYGIWEEINEAIQREPVEAGDPEILGLLASIGIQKGKKFEPDARMQAILKEAANVGAVTVRTLAARPRNQEFYFYPGEGVWTTPFIGGSHEFLDNGARLLDPRSYFFFYATGITPAMSAKMVGAGSQYAVAYVDTQGNPLDGSKTYKIHLPPNVPAKAFWSFTLYDNQTRAMLQTDQRFPAIGSLDKGVKPNADGSYDIYFGPKAPEGNEGNWVQTVPRKGWNVILRLYGPLEPWFDKTWRPGNPELVR